MARCIAKISGDGNLYYRYIRYSNTSRVLLEEFKEDIRKEFGEIKFTEGKVNSGTPFVQIHGQRVIGRFLEFLDDYRGSYIFVPDAIKKASIGIKKEYIRAFYDDEGSPNLRLFRRTKEWKRNITLSSNSWKQLEDIKTILLNDFSIISNDIFESHANNPAKRGFVLSITGKDNFVKFQKYINFKIPYKRARVAIIVQSYGNTYSRNRKGFEKIKEKFDLISRSK